MKFLFLDLSLYVDRAVVEVMSAQGTQGEENPLVRVGHEIPGAEDGAQVVQLTQVQIAQIVSNAVSQALTHQLQQLGNIPSTAAGNNSTHNTVAAQQYQTPIKFDVPGFEGDSSTSWSTWSQRVLYQARASGFDSELTAAVGEGLNVGADVFDSSNVDPVRLRNAHAAWMILINSCSGMALEIVQRCQAPNEAWRNVELHYRAKGTREILRLSHEINGKTMEPGSDPFKFMMEVDKLAGDLHRLGDKSVTELRKCVIIVSGLSEDFEMECRMLENNPDGLNRGEIERVVGNQYNRLLKQQQDSRHCQRRGAPSRQTEKTGRIGDSATSSKKNASIVGRKGTALWTVEARRRRAKNPELPSRGRRAVAAVGATSAKVWSTLRTSIVGCAGALSTGRETVRSAELKKVQCWQN